MEQSSTILRSKQFPVVCFSSRRAYEISLQMRQFVLDVLAQKQLGNESLSYGPYGDWLGENGNHVGFILFNDTVCALGFVREQVRMTAGDRSRITRYVHLPKSQSDSLHDTRLVIRVESRYCRRFCELVRVSYL